MDIGVWEAGVKRTPVAPAVGAFVYPATEFACIDGARRYRINRKGVETASGDRQAGADGTPRTSAIGADVNPTCRCSRNFFRRGVERRLTSGINRNGGD